jgi:hypothetical protein
MKFNVMMLFFEIAQQLISRSEKLCEVYSREQHGSLQLGIPAKREVTWVAGVWH